MEVICYLLGEGQRTTDNRSISETIKTRTDHLIELSNVSATPPLRSPQNITLLTSHLDPWDFYDWNKNVVVPFLCTIGILGNVLNIAVLGRRIHEGRSIYICYRNRFFLIEFYRICRILFLVMSGKPVLLTVNLILNFHDIRKHMSFFLIEFCRTYRICRIIFSAIL